jgi:hypothetical protein
VDALDAVDAVVVDDQHLPLLLVLVRQLLEVM